MGWYWREVLHWCASRPRNNVMEHSAGYSSQTHFEFWRTIWKRKQVHLVFRRDAGSQAIRVRVEGSPELFQKQLRRRRAWCRIALSNTPGS